MPQCYKNSVRQETEVGVVGGGGIVRGGGQAVSRVLRAGQTGTSGLARPSASEGWEENSVARVHFWSLARPLVRSQPPTHP